MLDTPAAVGGSSHVAGWVGVGGPGLGPHGEDEWLQVGLATFGDSSDGRLYYELTQPGHAPEYVELASGIVPGVRVRVAVMELQFARDAWIVVSPAGISGPFYLPRSHRAWEPVATAESYAETTQCNRYAYRFGGLQLTHGDGTLAARCGGQRRCRIRAGACDATAPPHSAPPGRERGYTSGAATARCWVV